MTICKICKSSFRGRKDKVFCSVGCKSSYHLQLKEVTIKATGRIDKILHRNRTILLEILGKKIMQTKVDRALLDQKKFNWHYHTHYHLNIQGKMVYNVYDFSWILFSNQEVLIKKSKSLMVLGL